MTEGPPSYESHFTLELGLHRELRGKRVVLASGSPRRKEIMAQMGFPEVEVCVSGFEENLDKNSMTPWEYVSQTSAKKAMAVYEKLSEDEEAPEMVIAADTILVLGHEVIEKPCDEKQHFAMLKRLRDSNTPHRVFTAITVIAPMDVPIHPGYVMKSHLEETRVKFDPELTDDFLQAYVRCGEGLDKAGGYGIQGKGALLIESIQGDYNNIVGLPVRATFKLMEDALNESTDHGY
ncbi:maf-like protein [Schizosaccharomyces japonicus yFS275]|uniref:Maf-like protein n=1 Tax=Schizosaccharomyces japonicus (strain yFS275 / FY16936) TaxID=402676 RepID=B6JYJ0_SCHJY|nr:maf-like protein [Schizosaccharomyces japonicus yFS275]EEB06608.1 maf-like protein [Schizosaccharomyces japonicus yFS275]